MPLLNSFTACLVAAAVCLRAWGPAKLCICIVRNVMDNLILGDKLRCRLHRATLDTGELVCGPGRVSGNLMPGFIPSFSICSKLCDGGGLWINPDYLNFSSKLMRSCEVEQAVRTVTKSPRL